MLVIIAMLLAYFVWSITTDYRQIRKNSDEMTYNTNRLVEIFKDYEITEVQFIPEN